MINRQLIQRIILASKWAMSVTFVGFILCLLISYPYAEQFTMSVQISAHILTIVFAGIFKAAAVALMAASKELTKFQSDCCLGEFACCNLKS